MSTPIGAVIRNPEAISHFTKNHAGVFSMIFNEKRAQPRSWITRLFGEFPIDGAWATDHAWGALPLMRPFYLGNPVRDVGVVDYTIKLLPHQYHVGRIVVNRRDKRDSKAPQSIESKMREPANAAARHEEVVFFELQAGAASEYLHRDVSFDNIFGGTGLFSNSHTYNGETLDNIVTKTITTPSSFFDAFYLAANVWDDARSDNGDEYWDYQKLEDSEIIIVVPTSLRQVVSQAVNSPMIHLGSNSGAATNYWREIFNSDKVQVVGSQKVTDGKVRAYRVSTGDADRVDLKPYYKAMVEGVRVKEWRETNSDWSKATEQEGIDFLIDCAYVPGNPLTAVEIAPAA